MQRSIKTPLNAFKGQFKDRWATYKVLILLCSLFFSLFTLLCSIFSDTIVQNGHDFIALPFRHVKANISTRKAIADVAATAAPDGKRLYLFVLDCSKSINGTKPPAWYQDIADILEQEAYPVTVDSEPNAEDAAKMSLYFLLRELVKNNSSNGLGHGSAPDAETMDEFAVWAVCEEGQKIFPLDDIKEKVSRANVDKAIRQLENGVATPSPDTTDFVNLFRKIRNTYSQTDDPHVSHYEMPNLIITIISDFFHDDGTPESNVEKSQRELEEETQRLSSKKIMMNMIVLAKDSGRDDTGHVFSYFRKNMEWYRINKEMIADDMASNGNKMLFPVFVAKDPLVVYYDNPVRIDGEFVLDIHDEGRIWVSLPSEIDNSLIDKFSLQFGSVKIGQDARQAEMTKRIVSGGDSAVLDMRRGESIVFKYEGPLPAQPARPMIKISTESDRRSHLVPIHFVKRLPQWAALPMLLLQVLGIAVLVIFAVSVLFGTWKQIGNLPEEPPSRSVPHKLDS